VYTEENEYNKISLKNRNSNITSYKYNKEIVSVGSERWKCVCVLLTCWGLRGGSVLLVLQIFLQNLA